VAKGVEETTVLGLVLLPRSAAVISAYVQLLYSPENCYLQALSPYSMSDISGFTRDDVAAAPKTLYTPLSSNINSSRRRIHKRQVLRISPHEKNIFTFPDGGVVWTACPGITRAAIQTSAQDMSFTAISNTVNVPSIVSFV
jgi:hypothetical protein